ncbi:MAG: hypothetical protein KBG48_33070 [Kofleriaceae bacterium]|nr:hypothetical protein [Kofleriaceae bacterium]MBP9861073.1 hypothetical protein [Kofleriaceae bacterium]
MGLTLPEGIPMPGGGDPLLAFDVGEDHEQWFEIRATLDGWGVSEGHVTTKFSREEVAQARWLDLVPDWHHGYPQPDEHESGYLSVTYDLSGWCSMCGIGLRQKAPFQMKAEPKWGRRGILQLNWVFDEYFVTPEVWGGLFKPRGIACRSVTNMKGAELETVTQLVVEEEVGIATDGLVPQWCGVCGRVKYRPHVRGFFPALIASPTQSMTRTREYFGSGAAADRRVLVSQELAGALIAAKVRGASLWPTMSRSLPGQESREATAP